MSEISHHPQLKFLGHVAVFYMPSRKLDDPRYGIANRTPRELLHTFLMLQYDAYTHQKSNIQGFWREDKQGQVFKDENEMFEVSFQGKERVIPFIDFLASLCYLVEEECLYLTMGYQSWLVLPKPNGSSEMLKLLKLS